MRKLKLEIETLEVDSFATGADDAPRGTVEARASGSYTLCQTECISDQTLCPCSGLPTLCHCP